MTDGDDYSTTVGGTWWYEPDESEWSLTFRLQRINGRMECVGMAIDAFPPGSRILKAPTLRALPFARELDRAVQEELERNARLTDIARRMGGRVPELEEQTAALTQRGKPRQRARYTHKTYKQVAAKYRELSDAGVRAPTRETAKALGLRYAQAAKIIQRCRNMDPPLLPPTQQGVGGVAGDSTEEEPE